MGTQEERFIKLEANAQKLVLALQKLNEEVVSYQSARSELKAAGASLVNLVQNTEKLSEYSHKILTIQNEIGSANMLEKLKAIESSIADAERREKQKNVLLLLGFGSLIIVQILLFIFK